MRLPVSREQVKAEERLGRAEQLVAPEQRAEQPVLAETELLSAHPPHRRTDWAQTIRHRF